MPDDYDWVGDWSGRRAMLTPEREAFYDNIEKKRYTYLQVDQRANQMANVLTQRGIQKGDRVAVYSKNRFDYLDLFFACGKIGAILVPFNVRLSKREVDYLMKKVKPKVVLYDPNLKGPFEEVRREMKAIDVLVMGDRDDNGVPATRQLMRESPDRLAEKPRLSLDDPYLIVFTGGTTGLPKGAILSHRLVFWNSVNTITSWGLRPDDVEPLLFPLFHTGGWNVLLVPMVHLGGKTIIMGDFDPEETLRVIESERATIVIGVPTMFQMIAESPKFRSTDLSSVRIFISGGAPCPVAIMEKYWAIGKDFKMGYGLTEGGPNNFYLPEREIRRKPSSVGFPVLHCDMKVVDDEMRPVRPGEVGELMLRGPHIFSGYWDDPEETAKTIEPDGWVHTGDLAVVDSEGFYSIVGRKKDMFISGGENVYPTEIEEVLYQHPKILEAAVVGIPDPKWGEVGKAFIVLKPGQSSTEAEIRSFLEGKLARYKIPKVYEFLDSLPKSAAGKILKRALQSTG
ncbi:MAG: long-chain fatty acid--CoA ligase [Candidatus Thorarchaeota archaeon]